MPRPLPDPTPPSRATIRTIHQLGDRIRATRAVEVFIGQAARHCGVSNLENGKGVNFEHALRVMDGLGLTMLVVPKSHAPWLEQAAAHAVKTGEDAAWGQHTWLEA
jgi:hypothetical protein